MHIWNLSHGSADVEFSAFLHRQAGQGSEVGSYRNTKKKRRVKSLKFLSVWWWAPKNAKEVTERFMKWKSRGKYKTLYPVSTMVGMNKAFQIVECDDIAEAQKDVAQWTDLCTFQIIPIMDSSEAVAVSRQ